MKRRTGILRISAFCLLLVFSQKTGIGLTFHNVFHKNSLSVPAKQSENKEKDISFACSCIDDFLMPFTASEEVVLYTPIVYPQVKALMPLPLAPVVIPSRFSLRGPPALI